MSTLGLAINENVAISADETLLCFLIRGTPRANYCMPNLAGDINDGLCRIQVVYMHPRDTEEKAYDVTKCRRSIDHHTICIHNIPVEPSSQFNS